jgi:hypothetical protein
MAIAVAEKRFGVAYRILVGLIVASLAAHFALPFKFFVYATCNTRQRLTHHELEQRAKMDNRVTIV